MTVGERGSASPSSDRILEELWSSESPSEFISFCARIGTVEEFVEFSKSRTRPEIELHRVRWDLDKQLVAVVPTADSSSKRAAIVEKFLNPIPVLFVESRGQYFNFAASLNRGIEEALKSNPDWILYTNDDMLQVDSIQSVLKLVNSSVSADFLLSKGRVKDGIWVGTATMSGILPSIGPEIWFTALYKTIQAREDRMKAAALLRKYNHTGLEVVGSPGGIKGHNVFTRVFDRFLSSRGEVFYNFHDFALFRRRVFSKLKFDSVFINGMEDAAFSLQLARNFEGAFIDFAIGSIGGATLSATRAKKTLRALRNTFNTAYFLAEYGKEVAPMVPSQ